MTMEALPVILKVPKVVYTALLMLAPMAILEYFITALVARSIDVQHYRDTVLQLCGQKGLDSLPSYRKMLFSKKPLTAENYPVTLTVGQQPL